MTLKTKILALITACFALVFLAACDDGDVIVQSPTDPSAVCGNGTCEVGENADNCSSDCAASVSITIGGNCNAGATDITCEESSTSNPAGNIEVATMVLRNSAGRSLATSNLQGGCGTAPSPACSIPFTGLMPGTYSVEHTVKPNDGGPAATANYTDLTVTGGG